MLLFFIIPEWRLVPGWSVQELSYLLKVSQYRLTEGKQTTGIGGIALNALLVFFLLRINLGSAAKLYRIACIVNAISNIYMSILIAVYINVRTFLSIWLHCIMFYCCILLRFHWWLVEVLSLPYMVPLFFIFLGNSSISSTSPLQVKLMWCGRYQHCLKVHK